MHTRVTSRRRERGSAFISVVVFTTVALLLVASLLGWSITERRLNYRNALRLESRNAAEALAEYGFSQIREKMETRSTINLNPNGTDALVMPPTSFWTGSNVDVSVNELIGGTVEPVPSTGGSYYFNPADPNNEEDPLKGKHVFRRDIQVIAKATVRPPTGGIGGPITSYVSQRISVRGAPLFAHAIFYNMDLEIFNGPAMTISGPVHANGNLYLYPENGALTFTDQVTATGGIYHAKKPGDLSADGNSAANRSAAINFPDKFSQSQNLRVDGIWKDTTQGNGTSATEWSGFRDFATQRWNGNLQTGAHGVDNYTPVAVGKYVEDPTPDGNDDSHNSGRTIIEPSNYPSSSDPDYAAKAEIEYQKYANNAGIYITVNPSTGTITATSRDREDPTKNKVLGLPSGLARLKRFKAVSSYTTTQTDKNYVVTSTGTGSNAGKYKYSLVTTTTATPKTLTYTSAGVTETAGTATVNTTTGNESNWRTSPPGGNTTSSSSTTPSSLSFAADNEGLYDRHRQKGTDLLEIDMDALRKAVAVMAGQSSATLSTGSAGVSATDAIGNLTTSDWTGIVYVEVVGGPRTDSTTGATTAATLSAANQTSVQLINGKGKVPSYGTANEGLTIATNAPLYVKGSFNADGTTSTSSPNSATDYETGEVPAAIVADAVTILSENFDATQTLTVNKPTATTSNIEVAAALLVGLTPTNKTGTGTTSGGAHNLPKFLEDWGGKSVFIRGSLVALFESRIFTEPHSNSYYGAPNRNWGFNKLFREGRYPPGTPRVMSYRRVDFTDLTATEYNTAKNGFSWPTSSAP